MARAALIQWAATPEHSRPKDIRSREQICAVLGISDEQYLHITTTGNFTDAVRNCLDHWKLSAGDVIQAVKSRALATTDPQQARFVAIFLSIIDHPAAQAVEALVEDGPGKRPAK